MRAMDIPQQTELGFIHRLSGLKGARVEEVEIDFLDLQAMQTI